MDTNKTPSSKTVRIVLAVVAGIIVALLMFQAGMYVGYRKATFSFGLGDNYYRAFGHRDFPGGHGAVGKIVRVSLPVITIEGPDNIEKNVLIGDDTFIRNGPDSGTSTDLKVGDFVVVLGSPDANSEIMAKLIRTVPPPPPIATSSHQ